MALRTARATDAPAVQATRPPFAVGIGLSVVVDGLLVLALSVVALSGWWSTFDSPVFLVFGFLGGLVGVGCAVAARRVPVPEPVARVTPRWLQLGALTSVVFAGALLVVGPPLTLFQASSGPLPRPASWGLLWHTVIHGWKELMTTLPPVSGTGRYLVLAFVLAGLGAAVMWHLRALRGPALIATLPAWTLLCVVAWLGLSDTPGVLLRSLLILGLSVVWAGVRQRRRSQATGASHQGGLRSGAAGVLILALVVGLTVFAWPRVGASTDPTLLRGTVQAPIDALDRPSPLAAFRRFRPVTDDLGDQELFTVRGDTQGQPVRIATMDYFSGTVWSAGSAVLTRENSPFLRLGTRVPVSASEDPVELSIEIGAAYAGNPDLAVWLPIPGQLRTIDFEGDNSGDLIEDVRFNPSTGAMVSAGGLKAGDRYSMTANPGVVPQGLGSLTSDVGVGSVGDPNLVSVVADYISDARLTGSPIEQLRSLAKKFKNKGAYTDGAGNEAVFTPGHSAGRLQSFLGGELAGNDEQYAAALALAAIYLGRPSRVMLGAIPGDGGVVTGAQVRTWVEVQQVDGEWISFAPETFIPKRDKKPKRRQEQIGQNPDDAVVPPPNAQRSPSTLNEFVLDDAESISRNRSLATNLWIDLPGWLKWTIRIGGPPLLVLALLVAAIVGWKLLRRRSRRTKGSPQDRIVGAWEELLDTLVDYRGIDLRGLDRVDTTVHIKDSSVPRLAATADRLTFGPAKVTGAEAVGFWESVQHTCGKIRRSEGRWKRLRGLVSWESLRPARSQANRSQITPTHTYESRVRSARQG